MTAIRKCGVILIVGILSTTVLASGGEVGSQPSEQIKTGKYTLGGCNIEISRDEKNSNLLVISASGPGSSAYLEYDQKAKTAECVFLDSIRYKADISVSEGQSSKTVTFHCGGKFSAADGLVRLTLDNVGKISELTQNLKIARYSTPDFSFPFLKDQADPLACRASQSGDSASAARFSGDALRNLGHTAELPERAVNGEQRKTDSANVVPPNSPPQSNSEAGSVQ